MPRGVAARLDAQREEIERRYCEGATEAELAREFGESRSSVQRALDRWGVDRREWFGVGAGGRPSEWRERLSRAKRAPIDEARLRELADGTRSTREIGEALGISEEKVRDEMVRRGLPRLEPKARSDRNAFWRGGYTVDKHGYILVKASGHPEANHQGYVREHRLVMERGLGRRLRPGEVVDHRNGDTSDNRPENLRLFASNAEHLRATRTGRSKLPAEEREALRREAVRRARRRVAATLEESGSDDRPSL